MLNSHKQKNFLHWSYFEMQDPGWKMLAIVGLRQISPSFYIQMKLLHGHSNWSQLLTMLKWWHRLSSKGIVWQCAIVCWNWEPQHGLSLTIFRKESSQVQHGSQGYQTINVLFVVNLWVIFSIAWVVILTDHFEVWWPGSPTSIFL